MHYYKKTNHYCHNQTHQFYNKRNRICNTKYRQFFSVIGKVSQKWSVALILRPVWPWYLRKCGLCIGTRVTWYWNSCGLGIKAHVTLVFRPLILYLVRLLATLMNVHLCRRRSSLNIWIQWPHIDIDLTLTRNSRASQMNHYTMSATLVNIYITSLVKDA